MEFSEIFRIVNLVVAGITVIGGVFHFFPIGLQNVVVGIYMIIFGLSIALLEFQVPPHVSRYASFLFSFVGRGVFYTFIGCLLLGEAIMSKIAGGIVGGIGLIYVVLEFIPSIEPPANMRDAELSGWGAEQVGP